jgi:hypothetical protein
VAIRLKAVLFDYYRYLVTIEYFWLNIGYLSNSSRREPQDLSTGANDLFLKDGAKRHPQIFNLQSSIFNSPPYPDWVIN